MLEIYLLKSSQDNIVTFTSGQAHTGPSTPAENKQLESGILRYFFDGHFCSSKMSMDIIIMVQIICDHSISCLFQINVRLILRKCWIFVAVVCSSLPVPWPCVWGDKQNLNPCHQIQITI